MTATGASMADQPLAGFLRRLRLHSALPDPDAAALQALPVTTARRGQNAHVFREGDRTQSCTVLVSGFAHRYRITTHGARQILAVYVPGDPIDFDHLYLPVADDTIQAIKPCALALIPQNALRQLMSERPAIAEAVVRSLLVDASVFREWTLNVGRRDARCRIAHLLCEISARLAAQGYDFQDTPLPLTQDHIADATGLTVVHVNRTLKALHGEGAIRRRGALVMLPEPGKLREIADFDDQYLHAENRGLR